MTSAACKGCGRPMPCACCCIFRGRLNARGYGVVNRGRQRWAPSGRYKGHQQVLVHRWLMEQALGRSLKPDEVVMHECDQPACVFLGHLRVASQAENMADMRAKGRAASGAANHAPRGTAHPCARLNDDAVRFIRSQRGRMASRVLSFRFAVSAATIRDVWIERKWRHVD